MVGPVRTPPPSAFVLSFGALLLGCPSSSPSPSSSSATSGEAPAQPEQDRPGPWMSAALPPLGPSASASAGAPTREIVGAAHILVAYKGALGAPKTITRTKEAAKTRAEEALAKLK